MSACRYGNCNKKCKTSKCKPSRVKYGCEPCRKQPLDCLPCPAPPVRCIPPVCNEPCVIGCGTGVITKFSKFGVDLDVNNNGNTYNESQFFNSTSGGIEVKELIESVVVGGFEGGTSCFNINFLDKVPESIFVSESTNGLGPVPPVFNGGLNSRGPVVCCGDLVSCCGFYQYTNSCFAGGFQQGLLTSTIVLAFIFHIIASKATGNESSVDTNTIDLGGLQTLAVWRSIFAYLSFTFSRYGYYKLFYLKNSKTIQLYLSNLPGSSNNISVTNFVSGTANLVLDGAYDCCETGLGGRRYTGALNASGSEIDTSISLAQPSESPSFSNTILDQTNIQEPNQYFGTLTLNIDIPGLNTCN